MRLNLLKFYFAMFLKCLSPRPRDALLVEYNRFDENILDREKYQEKHDLLAYPIVLAELLEDLEFEVEIVIIVLRFLTSIYAALLYARYFITNMNSLFR